MQVIVGSMDEVSDVAYCRAGEEGTGAEGEGPQNQVVVATNSPTIRGTSSPSRRYALGANRTGKCTGKRGTRSV